MNIVQCFSIPIRFYWQIGKSTIPPVCGGGDSIEKSRRLEANIDEYMDWMLVDFDFIQMEEVRFGELEADPAGRCSVERDAEELTIGAAEGGLFHGIPRSPQPLPARH